MANCIMIMGPTGNGKSTSIKGLDPKSTVIFNVLKKRLPFKGSNALYNAENKNLFNIDDHATMISYLESISNKALHVTNVVIDDMTYIMRKEYFKTAKQTGFNKFVDMASHFQQIISTIESLREDLNVFLLMHCDPIESDGAIIGYKASTVGKLIDNSYNPIEVVPMLLFCKAKFNEKGEAQFGFYTHKCMDGTVELPAKTPADMFEEDFIPNDLGLVVKAMTEYYG